MYRTCSASSCATAVSSGLAPAANTWYHVTAKSTTAGTVVFTINGANSQSIATNVPTTAVSPGFRIGTQTGTARNLDAD
ncbi:LamG-like jellyroll fold domain-containing protein, partial [Streptococcus pneumoniae]|uniref:LamG-like jellyroll fold domain-containing protein n=1 Tax=Streptococcus pneumoniae TaxID=1313 RepID=UPI0034DCFB62